MADVKPFYAVKCNPHPSLLGSMAALGARFDCASRAEIDAVLSLGVSPDRIVYANPCKAESHIRYAAAIGVNLTTFDSEHEVEKIRKWHPSCSLLIRIKPPDEGGARCPLGQKYGTLSDEVVPLLMTARAAKLAVVGVSFHVGSGMVQSEVYSSAIAEARKVFDVAEELGTASMHVLNIGEGFTAGVQFDEAAQVIMSALSSYFSDKADLMVAAEPGRFFAETTFTLATKIVGKRVRGELRKCWINDGIYGSMNCILYDHATVKAFPFVCSSETCRSKTTNVSTVFGPTCDALNTVLTEYWLPELQVGDWLVLQLILQLLGPTSMAS